MRGRQSDKFEKDLTEQDMPNSHKNKGYLESSRSKGWEGETERWKEDSCTETVVQRQVTENKPDTGEDRTSQRTRSQNIRTHCQS